MSQIPSVGWEGEGREADEKTSHKVILACSRIFSRKLIRFNLRGKDLMVLKSGMAGMERDVFQPALLN